MPKRRRGHAQAEPFDLVLVDSLAVPHDLFGPTRPVREAARATPVVLFTGYQIEPEVAASAGFFGVLGRPFDIDMLPDQLGAIFTSAASELAESAP